MASSSENMGRFAHDVCVHVLEKFGIFKAPDDTRKQNKYVHHDFLPRISRSVISFAIWIRTYFKNGLENKCKTAALDDNDVMWIFEDQLLQSAEFSTIHWVEKVCLSLALCTEYVQFANTKGHRVSLNKLVIGWNEFFEKHLKSHFEEDFGFLALYNYLEESQMCQLGEFQEAFITEYCLPYGKIECITELAKKCIEKRGFNISLDKTVFGIKTLSDIDEGFFRKIGNFSKDEELKFEYTSSGTSDSERDSSSTFVDSVIEASPEISSDDSDSKIVPNDLLGIPPHEETLREIDPFFVENIPSPPKAHSSSESGPNNSGSSGVPGTSSKSPENEASKSEDSKLHEAIGPIVFEFFSKLYKTESGLSDASESPSKMQARQSVPRDAQSGATPKSTERESGSSAISKSPSELEELENITIDAPSQPISKSPEHETGASNDPKSSKSIERVPGSNEVSNPSSQSPRDESTPSDTSLSSSQPPGDESTPSDASLSSSQPPGNESAQSEAGLLSLKLPKDESASGDIPQQYLKSSEGESAQREACLSKLPEDESTPGAIPKFPNSSEGEFAQSDSCLSSLKSCEGESAPSDVPQHFSKSSEGESAPSDVPQHFSKSSEGETAPSDVPQHFSKSSEGESAPSDVPQHFSKSSEGESVPSDATQKLTTSPVRESVPSDATQKLTTSPVRESVPSGACSQGPPETEEELKEKVDQILTRLEDDMDELRYLLFNYGLIQIKPGRRGGIKFRVQEPKDERPPRGPEGLI